MNTVLFLLMAPREGENSMSFFIMMGMIIVVFYFFMIRPQSKKAKEQRKFRESIAKGDRIVTIGGIHGKIAEVKETTVVMETEGGHRMKVEKNAISKEFTAVQGESELGKRG